MPSLLMTKGTGLAVRHTYGFRDEEYFRLKILTCMLPKL